MHDQRRPLGHSSTLRLDGPQQLERLNADAIGNAFEALERQVPLAALDTTHVGPMDAEDVGESLLAQPASFAVGTKVPADSSLQVKRGKFTLRIDMVTSDGKRLRRSQTIRIS